MPKTLKSIVAIKDKDPWQNRIKFLQALEAWAWSGPNRKGTPFEQWPEMPRMIWTLCAIHGEVFSSGLLYLIDRETGDHVAFGKKWLKKIGAKRSVAYLDAMAKLFPDRKIPTTVEARAEALREVFPDDDDMEQLDAALTPIDRKYREEVINEIPDRLRAYVRSNIAAIEKDAKQKAKKGNPDDVILREDEPQPFRWMHLLVESRADFKAQIAARDPHPKIGDVIEVFDRKHYVYLQATHGHFYERTEGPIYRILPGAHKKPLTSKQVKDLVEGPELYFALFNLVHHREWAARDPRNYKGKFREVGNFPVPASARAFPTFMYNVGRTRDGRNVWDLWTGGEFPESRVISPLPEHLKNLPLPTNFDSDFLVRDVLEGCQPIDEHKRLWGEM